KAFNPQFIGEILANPCIISGIAKTGTQTPPSAAKIITEVAPKGADCSCVSAYVPSKTPKPIAANPENKATIVSKPKFVHSKAIKPKYGKTNFPMKSIT